MAYKRKASQQKLHRRTGKAVHSAVVPHKNNDYRPHLIRWYGLAAVIFVVLVLQASYNFLSTGSVLGATTDITAPQLLAATNQQREGNDEHPLTLSTSLNEAAKLKADDMFDRQYWAHNAPDGTQPWAWFEKVGYDYNEAGENLAKGFHSSDAVVTAWMGSEEHRENILNVGYTQVGFAVKSGELNGKKTTLVVALYGQPTTGVSQASAGLPAVLAANNQQIGLVERIGIGVQSMTPALLGSIILLLITILVAFFAHTYRNHLPNRIRMSRMKHHGLYKALGLVSLVVICVGLYGTGQI